MEWLKAIKVVEGQFSEKTSASTLSATTRNESRKGLNTGGSRKKRRARFVLLTYSDALPCGQRSLLNVRTNHLLALEEHTRGQILSAATKVVNNYRTGLYSLEMGLQCNSHLMPAYYFCFSRQSLCTRPEPFETPTRSRCIWLFMARLSTSALSDFHITLR